MTDKIFWLMILVAVLIVFTIGYVTGASVATSMLQEEATLHCGAFFHPNDASFTWVKCAEGLE